MGDYMREIKDFHKNAEYVDIKTGAIRQSIIAILNEAKEGLTGDLERADKALRQIETLAKDVMTILETREG